MNSSDSSPLRASLNFYAERYPEEAAVSHQFLDLMSAWPECLRRDHFPGHFTASAWIMNENGTHVALVHHKKLARWLQPGGHADGEADLLNVAQRELAEETGLIDVTLVAEGIFDLDIHEIPARQEIPRHLHYDVRFAFQTEKESRLSCSQESSAVSWISLAEEFSSIADASLHRMRSKWLSRGIPRRNFCE